MKITVDGQTAYLEGRLDTAATPEAQAALAPIFENASKTVILDCTHLEYISSSGLRIFLMLRKEASAKGGSVVIKGISDDIRKVFIMTGFVNLFTFE